jgi:N-sulfoglucosamine sulfohydrolase
VALGLLAVSAAGAQRNVVLFVADDHGRDMGCYGNPVIRTPNLDQLAAEGTRFEYAFCTTASCSASRSVILTGLQNHRNGQFGHVHSYHDFDTHDWVVSLPVLLRQAGYRTASIGKFHVQPESVYDFDVRLGGNQGCSRNPVTMAERTREWLAQESGNPFFLYFCTSDPHRGGWRKDLPYQPNGFGNTRDYRGVNEVEYDPEDVIVPPFLPDTPTCRAELAQYYQSVSRIDQGVGRLISILKELDQYEDTLFVYISDHGIAFPGGKTTLYEPGMRSPCIVRSPDQDRRGMVSEAMISWVDLVPTLLDYAGAQAPEYDLHGRSFLDVLDQPDPAGWDEVYASHTFHEVTMYYPMRVVRGRRYKLIWNIAHELPYPFASDLWAAPTWQTQYQKGQDTLYGKRSVGDYIHRPQFELYDLRNDPHEIHNLAEDSDHAEVMEQYKAKVKSFQERTEDPWILKWNYE